MLLSTEGTYPFSRGGVSTWCDALVHRVPGTEFILYAVLMHPFISQKYPLPPSVRETVRVPLWGTQEPSEHLRDIPFSSIYLAKKRTTQRVIREHFLPLFRDVLESIFAPAPDIRRLGRALLDLHRFFREHDYLAAFKSAEAWALFRAFVAGDERAAPSVFDAVQMMGWLYRFFIILNTPVPRADVSHSSAAAFCGLPCILGKLERRTPYLLTEHGVYLREQYLAVSRSDLSPDARRFLLSLVTAIVQLNYHFADQISPVCAYNTRWERELGVAERRIRVIYNGVDPRVFALPPAPPRDDLTVVAVARIDPIKDIETLLRAAALVREQLPEAKFIVYGSVSVPAYYQRCLALRDSLGLAETFIFAGHVDNVSAAYQTGSVVALSSISEAFPFSVIEAMMVGRPVVATDVGGVREALEDTGLLVPPRDPAAMASACLRLLRDPELRSALAEAARERALAYFTIDRAIELYRRSYLRLRSAASLERRLARVRLHLERAYALQEAGEWGPAVEFFKNAVKADPSSPANPVILMHVARLHLRAGRLDLARQEMERAKALAAAQRRTA